jgi:hypothetical protein
MRTPTFAVVVAMATALHAEPIEQYLRTLRGEGVSGLHERSGPCRVASASSR